MVLPFSEIIILKFVHLIDSLVSRGRGFHFHQRICFPWKGCWQPSLEHFLFEMNQTFDGGPSQPPSLSKSNLRVVYVWVVVAVDALVAVIVFAGSIQSPLYFHLPLNSVFLSEDCSLFSKQKIKTPKH